MSVYKSQKILSVNADADMQQLGVNLARALKAGTVVHLHGDLGAGKTTLVRGVLRGLDYLGKVKSPTYTLVEPYETANFTLNHFDLYRINDPYELHHIGINEYFCSDTVCMVEWPEKGKLPPADIDCYIKMMGTGNLRQVKLQAMTETGEEVLARL